MAASIYLLPGKITDTQSQTNKRSHTYSPPTLYIFAAIASRSLNGRTTLNTHIQSIFVATTHHKSAISRN